MSVLLLLVAMLISCVLNKKIESSKLEPADILFLGYNEQKNVRKNVVKYKNTYVKM
jgi:hypothetical protein